MDSFSSKVTAATGARAAPVARVARAIVVAVAVVALGVLPVAGSAAADPPATQVVTAVAVGTNGEPMDGYQEAPQGESAVVTDCTKPSPSAVADDIYYCSPTAAAAGTCWPSTPESLLCVDDPWTKQLHRVSYAGQLPQVQPTSTPDPFAVVLDDGTQCRLRNGGAWGGRADGYVGVYGCGDPGSNLAVLWLPSAGPGTCFDRSAPLWTVKLGQLGTPTDQFPPPQTRGVATAWFAGNPSPS